jgi:hypothetical protein
MTPSKDPGLRSAYKGHTNREVSAKMGPHRKDGMAIPEIEAYSPMSTAVNADWRSELSLGERLMRVVLMLAFLGVMATEAYLVWQVIILTE